MRRDRIRYGTLWCPLVGLGPFPLAMQYTVLWATLTAVTGPSIALVRTATSRRLCRSSFAQSIFVNALALALVVFVRPTATEYMLGQLVGEAVAAAIALTIEPPKLPSRVHVPKLVRSFRFTSVWCRPRSRHLCSTPRIGL